MNFFKKLLNLFTTTTIYHPLDEDDVPIPDVDPERMDRVLCEEKEGGGFEVVQRGTKEYNEWIKKEQQKLRNKMIKNYYKELYKNTPWYLHQKNLHEIEVLLKIKSKVGSYMICKNRCASTYKTKIFIYYLNENHVVQRVPILASHNDKLNRTFYSILGTNEHFECLLDVVEKPKKKKVKPFEVQLTVPFREY